ncbi:MAG TPA: dihydroorotase [Armatimonadota bacterium]|nr:dihydroorotase [Armatimonadota bacterium]
MPLLLKGGRVVDPSQSLDKVADVLVESGRIAEIGDIDPKAANLKPGQVEDISGKLVLPGLIDMHVHFREPGFEYKEDITTGSKAAAAGGFTAVATMPNTNPVTDSRSVVEFILCRAQEVNLTKIHPIGALTKELKGEEMAEIGDMIEGGAAAFSDDAFPIQNSSLMRRVMDYCAMFGVPVILHCEDKSLSDEGLMNEGLTATILGLRGIPAEAEEIAVARNIMLARLTGCRMHVAHVSTRGSVEFIRRAKEAGLQITCETCPQYFSLTEEAVKGYDTNAKMNPPLRTADDVAAVKEGLADGTIDVIATDHAPHAIEEKETEFAAAASGMVGLETAVGLVVTELVKPGMLSLSDAFEKMSSAPARILGLDSGTLQVGKAADVTVVDPAAEFVVDPSRFHSRSKNTPLAGRKLTGVPVLVLVNGRIVARAGEVVA